MRMLAAAILVVASLPAFADEVDGVIYMHEPGVGFYVINHAAGVFHVCRREQSFVDFDCWGPWILPDPDATTRGEVIQSIIARWRMGGLEELSPREELVVMRWMRWRMGLEELSPREELNVLRWIDQTEGTPTVELPPG